MKDPDVRALESAFGPEARKPILAALEKRAKNGGLSSQVRAQLADALSRFITPHLMGEAASRQFERMVELVGADAWERLLAGWRAGFKDKTKIKQWSALRTVTTLARHAPRSVVTPSVWETLLDGWIKVGDRDGSVGDAIARAPNCAELIQRRVKSPPGGWPVVIGALSAAAREGVDVGFAIQQLDRAAAKSDPRAAEAALVQHLRDGNVAAAKRILALKGKLAVPAAVAQLRFATLHDVAAVVAFLPAALAHKAPEVSKEAAAVCTRLAIFGVDLSPAVSALEKVLTHENRGAVDASNALGWMMLTKARKPAEAALKRQLSGSERKVINAASGLAIGYAHRSELSKVDALLEGSVPVREGCVLGLSSAQSLWPYLSLDRGASRPPPLPCKVEVEKRLKALRRDPSPLIRKLFS